MSLNWDMERPFKVLLTPILRYGAGLASLTGHSRKQLEIQCSHANSNESKYELMLKLPSRLPNNNLPKSSKLNPNRRRSLKPIILPNLPSVITLGYRQTTSINYVLLLLLSKHAILRMVSHAVAKQNRYKTWTPQLGFIRILRRNHHGIRP